MGLVRASCCKVNLVLNILGRRADGFHELETVMHPVGIHDLLEFRKGGDGIQLTCNLGTLASDASNIVHRAAGVFLNRSGIREGVRIHLEKRIPLAAGLGGGSGNAAATLVGLNELFDHPLGGADLRELASGLGSDVPFFLQSSPALATGRGECITPLDGFAALRGMAFLLVHPGFGISTAWSYRQVAGDSGLVAGQPGRAQRLIQRLADGDVRAAAAEFYNTLEVPALEKFPVLRLYQDMLREGGAWGALMSGSGSCTFALVAGCDAAKALQDRFVSRFGTRGWSAVVAAEPS